MKNNKVTGVDFGHPSRDRSVIPVRTDVGHLTSGVQNVQEMPKINAERSANFATQWKPIETAPKDGTRIIITDGSYVNMASFEECIDPDEDWKPVYCWCVHDCEDAFYSWLIPEDNPTHWMSIPEVPK